MHLSAPDAVSRRNNERRECPGPTCELRGREEKEGKVTNTQREARWYDSSSKTDGDRRKLCVCSCLGQTKVGWMLYPCEPANTANKRGLVDGARHGALDEEESQFPAS